METLEGDGKLDSNPVFFRCSTRLLGFAVSAERSLQGESLLSRKMKKSGDGPFFAFLRGLASANPRTHSFTRSGKIGGLAVAAKPFFHRFTTRYTQRDILEVVKAGLGRKVEKAGWRGERVCERLKRNAQKESGWGL